MGDDESDNDVWTQLIADDPQGDADYHFLGRWVTWIAAITVLGLILLGVLRK